MLEDAMSRTRRITEAEWAVMAVVWDKHPITSLEIAEQLSPEKGWSVQTVKTLLSRLRKKGVLTYKRKGQGYLYRPKVSKAQCVREESNSFAARVLGGNPTPLLAHLVRSAKLSPQDIRELRQILSDKER